MARDFEFLESTWEAPAAPDRETLARQYAEHRLGLRLQTVVAAKAAATRLPAVPAATAAEKAWPVRLH